MLVIGLTGGIGSGKSTVATLFKNQGVPIIDTDDIARDVVQPEKPAWKKIIAEWGSTILLPTQQLNRSEIKKIIFSDPNKKKWLEALLHPFIRAEVKQQIESLSSSYCIVVIPLLVETQPNPLIDRILVVDASEEQQMHRTQIRDHLSLDEVNAILKTQVSRADRLKAADDVIHNEEDLENLLEQVKKLHGFYLSLIDCL